MKYYLDSPFHYGAFSQKAFFFLSHHHIFNNFTSVVMCQFFKLSANHMPPCSLCCSVPSSPASYSDTLSTQMRIFWKNSLSPNFGSLFHLLRHNILLWYLINRCKLHRHLLARQMLCRAWAAIFLFSSWRRYLGVTNVVWTDICIRNSSCLSDFVTFTNYMKENDT